MATVLGDTEEVNEAAERALPPGMEESYEDYFGVEDDLIWYFPDQRQFISYSVMNEGQKAKFQKQTSSDLMVMRATGDAKMKVDTAAERWALINAAVVGWNIMRKNKSGQWESVAFSKDSPGSTLFQWLNTANPKHVENLEKAIRNANPWLLGEMTVEDIDKELANLAELRIEAVKRESGKEPSSNR